MNKLVGSPPNFERLVLGCIDADLWKYVLVGKAQALDEIYRIYIPLHRSDLKISTKLAVSKMNKKSKTHYVRQF